ncbi:MAG: cytochrome c biogenesis protein CcsA [Bacteroidota bacterium]|nr:cytochrome c biogenesis protein CcsA [Bacteroidota bacterium]
MTEIQYVGEHIWAYYFGHILILIAFFSALYAMIAAVYSKRSIDLLHSVWVKPLKLSLSIHITAVIGIIALLFYIMIQHYYEFQYVWAHVSDELPMRYIFSAFWEGQEGSFLLWMFWNCVLILFFLSSKSKLHIGILAVIAGVELILMSMLLGIYFFDAKIGSNPYLLLRHTMDIPLFKNAEYVNLIKGNGMNPLLQNYWMIIHPPTLFLGFASTVIPFAYAFSSLWNRDYTNWLKPSLVWTLFSAGVLGTGVLMGGAWAYEALSFGGYWAWDPVENMSLVPWIVLISGIHLHMIALNTKYSLRSLYIFYFLGFILVVYSTFLTRSGILGDSSAHAFTQMGLEWQLVIFLAIITIIPFYFFAKRRKEIPEHKVEERIESREFWMFIGSLVLLFSAGLITFTTSIPVYNKLLDLVANLFNTNFESYHKTTPLDPIAHHNRFQLWTSILIAFLAGCSVYLRYLGQQLKGLPKKFYIQICIVLLGSVVLTFLISQSFSQLPWHLYIFLAAGCFVIISSAQLLWRTLTLNPSFVGALTAHAGFGILLLGIIFTGINRKSLTPELFFQEDLSSQFEDSDERKHFILLEGDPKFVKGYWVTYTKDTLEGNIRKYTVNFVMKDSMERLIDSFTVYPEIQYDNKMTKVAASNPSIRRYFNRDIFTLIAQIPLAQTDVESAQQAEDSLQYERYEIGMGDTLFTRKHFILLTKVHTDLQAEDFLIEEQDQKLQLELAVRKLEDDSVYVMKTGILFRGNLVYRFPGKSDKLGMKLQIPDTIYNLLSKNPNALRYQSTFLKEGETKSISENFRIQLHSFDKNPQTSAYVREEGDIALAAHLKIHLKGSDFSLKPIFIIRNNRTIPLAAQNLYPGITIKFTKINPETGEMNFEYSIHDDIDKRTIPLDIAENAPRNDFIVMEAIEFPWINLVWLGSLMMMAGLFIASFFRKKSYVKA